MSEVAVRWIDSSGDVRLGDESSLPCLEASWVWIDVKGPTSAILAHLADLYGLHPLVVDNVLRAQHRANIDVYPNGVFLVWLTPPRCSDEVIAHHELDIFLGEKCLITFHVEPDETLEKIALYAKQTLSGSADWLLHAVIDFQVDASLPFVDEIGEQLSSLEDEMIENPKQEDLNRLHTIRRQLVRLHRIIAPERDVVRGLGRNRGAENEEIYRYFQDIGDHLSMLLDSIETYQDVATSAMDVYLSAQNNRMNLIMKQLTVVATLFMPLTFLSGIYGMNVTNGMWPPTDAWWSFPAVVGVMVLIGTVMATYFKRKKWW